MNDQQNQSNSADDSYRKIFEALNASEEGRDFLGTFLKKHRDDISRKPHKKPTLVATDTNDLQARSDLKSPVSGSNTNRHNSEILTPSNAFPHLQQGKKAQETTQQTLKNPVLFALRELASNLKKTEAETKKAQEVAANIRELAKLLDRQAVPSSAGQLLRMQANELDRLVKFRQQSNWQVAKVVQVLQILENYVKRESVAQSS